MFLGLSTHTDANESFFQFTKWWAWICIQADNRNDGEVLLSRGRCFSSGSKTAEGSQKCCPTCIFLTSSCSMWSKPKGWCSASLSTCKFASLKSSSCDSDMAGSLKYTWSVASFKGQCYQMMRSEISQEDPKWCPGFYFPSLLKLECSKFKLRKCLLLNWFIRDTPP